MMTKEERVLRVIQGKEVDYLPSQITFSTARATRTSPPPWAWPGRTNWTPTWRTTSS